MKCGLIGGRLGHSFSPQIHRELADYSYELFELTPEEVGDFVRNSRLDAFNVTIPYKKDVIPFLDHISDEAAAIGAVNTVVTDKSGKKHGYNTDFFGFSHMIDLSGTDICHKKTLVIGAGGASATVCAVLKARGAELLAVLGSRDNTPENLARFTDAEVIVNTSPVGMYPKNCVAPLSLGDFPKCVCVLDVIANPALTALQMDAEERGIVYVGGLPMLVAQAAQAFNYFTGDSYEEGCIEKITASIYEETMNIVLVGMPGCGKSTVGRLIAEKTGKRFVDADEEFERTLGISPAASIETMGEDRFRELEHDTLTELGKQSGLVIATGGGAVTRDCNYPVLHQNGKIFFIERKLENLACEGRPISMKTPVEELYARRIDAYRGFADATVYSNEIAEETAQKIVDEFKALTHKGKI